MAENIIERDVNAAESKLRKELDTIEKLVGNVAPVGKRMLTRREKLARSLATPARSWTPAQSEFVLKALLRIKDGGRP